METTLPKWMLVPESHANKEIKRLLHMAAVSVLTKKTANSKITMSAKWQTAKQDARN
jgi:hypothetical protein